MKNHLASGFLCSVVVFSALFGLPMAIPTDPIPMQDGLPQGLQSHALLRPALCPTVDTSMIDNLEAATVAHLYYDSDADPSVDSTNATLSVLNSERPVVQLENSQFIESLECTDTTVRIIFSDRTAYSTAANDWKTHSNLILVSHDPACGRGYGQGKHSFLVVKGVAVTSAIMTIDVAIDFVDFRTAFGESASFKVEVGRYVAPDYKRSIHSITNDISWNEYPTTLLNRKEWPSGYQLYHSPTLDVACIGCGTDGQMTLTGSFAWSWDSFEQADISLAGKMKAKLQLGIHADNSIPEVPIKKFPIISLPLLGGFTIAEVMTVGPQLNMAIEGSIGISQYGSVLVGATLDWPTLKADMDLKHGTFSGSGFQPNIVPIWQADPKYHWNGPVDVELDFFMPITLGVGVSFVNGLWQEEVEIVERAGVKLSASADDISTECSGVDLAANIYNKLYFNILNLKRIPIFSWTKPILNACLKSGHIPRSTADILNPDLLEGPAN